MSRKHLPVVAIVGRPNVGKSTFYNRVMRSNDAVVDDLPGVTRDRRDGEAVWDEVRFRLVDTGGLVPGTQDSMESAILIQAQLALEEADVILFMVDAREGITALDEEIAASLRPVAEKVLLVANKVEGPRQEEAAAEAASLGMGTPRSISAEHALGTGDLLEEVIARLPKRTTREDDEPTIRVSLLGKPNVGKSSIVNRLLGEDRVIVHDAPGTTRDAIDVVFRYNGYRFEFVDTAGLRRRSHVETGVEFYSTLRTRKSLRRSDVVLLVLDATESITFQEARIAGEITEAGKSMIFLVNKWDLVEKENKTVSQFTRKVRDRFPLLAGSPILFVSALTGQRVRKIPEIAIELHNERNTTVSTSRLNEILAEATDRVHPPLRSGYKPVKLYYMTQTSSSPPVFAIFVNDPKSVVASYRQYLKNSLREALDLTATPIRLEFRSRR